MRLSLPPNGEWTTRALVDTGAPVTVFDRGAADALGVRIRNTGAVDGTVRLLGRTLNVQFEIIDLCLRDDPALSWSARVAFIKNQQFQMAFQGILGTEGFLDRFAVTFNKYYDWFQIVPADDEE